jgi:hypothetical protein
MARSIDQIYQSIIASKNTYLPQLTNNRPTSVWNRMAYIFAIATNLLEQLFDSYRVELTDLTNQSAYGSKDWLIRKAYEFQYSGTDPQVISWVPARYRYEYASIIEAYKIITHASVQVVTGNQVRVKVAKGAVGSLGPLTTDEYNATKSYFNTICPAGQYIDLVSVVGDTISMTLDIYSEGQIPSSLIESQSRSAISNYLNGVSFDGIVYAASVVDAVQSLEGIINVVLVNNGGTIQNTLNGFIAQNWTNSVQLYAGYSGTINLTLNVYPQ